jgi:hypothetical protein
MEAPAETVRSAAPTPEPIMGDDEAALLRLWREKRCEVEAEELSANLIRPARHRD